MLTTVEITELRNAADRLGKAADRIADPLMERFLRDESGTLTGIAARASAEHGRQGVVNHAAVLAWLMTTPMIPPEFAFTAGPERELADWILLRIKTESSTITETAGEQA